MITQQEFFELKLNIDESRISVEELIGYLDNTATLIKSINQTLNKKYSIGYDDIGVDILALEKGSFKIPISIRKNIRQFFIATAATVIGEIIANLLTNNQTNYTISTPTETIDVNNNIFLENVNTQKTIGRIAQMAVEKDSITDIVVTYEHPNGKLEQVTINKETLSQIKSNEEATEQIEQLTNIQENIKLEIVSPVFLDKPTNWKVLHNNEAITAQMADKDFLETMDAQKIAFAKGDAIIADLECVATNSENGIKMRYYIRKVYSYPKYTKIIRKG